MIDGTREISKNALHRIEMGFTRIMHVQSNLLNCIGNIRPGEGEVLKSTHQVVVHSGVNDGGAGGAELGLRVDWSSARVAGTHADTI